MSHKVFLVVLAALLLVTPGCGPGGLTSQEEGPSAVTTPVEALTSGHEGSRAEASPDKALVSKQEAATAEAISIEAMSHYSKGEASYAQGDYRQAILE